MSTDFRQAAVLAGACAAADYFAGDLITSVVPDMSSDAKMKSAMRTGAIVFVGKLVLDYVS